MPVSLNISKSFFKEPQKKLCAAALFALSLQGPFGSVNALLFFVLIALVAVRFYGQLLFILSRYWLFLLFPLLCLASSFWSEDRILTLRYAGELIFTYIGALLIGRMVNPWTMVRMVFLAGAVLVLMSLTHAPKSISAHSALTGVFESKNAMANESHILFTASLAILFGEPKSIILRLSGLVMALISLVTLYLSQSAGAMIAFGISLTILTVGSLYLKTPAKFRPLVLIAAVFITIVFGLSYPIIRDEWASFQQDVLHKDSTLSGRTYLWEFAGRLIRERPLLGHGAGSFWREGNIDAEGIWTRYSVPGHHGFNFHNTFIETAVGTGYIGVGVVGLLLFLVAARLLTGFAKNPSPAKLFLIAYFAAWYIRLPTEVLLGPFDSATLLLVAAGVFAAERAPSKKPVKEPSPRPEKVTLPTGGLDLVTPRLAGPPAQ